MKNFDLQRSVFYSNIIGQPITLKHLENPKVRELGHSHINNIIFHTMKANNNTSPGFQHIAHILYSTV